MEIMEAFDLTGSYRAAAELAGCDHHTVARYEALREAGQPLVAREHRVRPIHEYLDKIEELVARSDGRVRADVVHERITAMGSPGHCQVGALDDHAGSVHRAVESGGWCGQAAVGRPTISFQVYRGARRGSAGIGTGVAGASATLACGRSVAAHCLLIGGIAGYADGSWKRRRSRWRAGSVKALRPCSAMWLLTSSSPSVGMTRRSSSPPFSSRSRTVSSAARTSTVS